MKNSGIEWIGEIPDDWNLIRNRWLFQEHSVKVGENSSKYQLLSLTTGGVKEKDINSSGGKVPESYDNYQTVEKGDMIFCLFDSDCSAVFSGLSRVDGMITSAYDVLKPNSDYLDEQFADFWFQYVFSNRYYKIYSKNIRYTVTSDTFKGILTPIPSLKQQKAIGSFLSEKSKQIDILIANQSAQIEKLKAYKQSVITEAVTKGLEPTASMKDSGVEWIGSIPLNWNINRLKYICSFNPPCEIDYHSHLEVSYAPMECVGNGTLEHREIAVEDIKSGLTCFTDEDIVMAKVTPCFENGNIAIAKNLKNTIAFGSSELFVFRAHSVLTNFLFYFLRNIKFVEQAKATMTGTGGLKRVSPEFVRSFTLSIPPKQEQQKIADYLDKKCAEIDKLISIKQQKIEKLNEYKKSLICEYVTGKKEAY